MQDRITKDTSHWWVMSDEAGSDFSIVLSIYITCTPFLLALDGSDIPWSAVLF